MREPGRVLGAVLGHLGQDGRAVAVRRTAELHGDLAADAPEPSSLDGHDLDVHLVLRGGIRLERFWVDWLTEYLTAHAGATP